MGGQGKSHRNAQAPCQLLPPGQHWQKGTNWGVQTGVGVTLRTRDSSGLDGHMDLCRSTKIVWPGGTASQNWKMWPERPAWPPGEERKAPERI